MASLKVKFRPSTVEGKEGGLYFQIIHNRVVRQLNTDYKVFAHEWDEEEPHIAKKMPYAAEYSILYFAASIYFHFCRTSNKSASGTAASCWVFGASFGFHATTNHTEADFTTSPLDSHSDNVSHILDENNAKGRAADGLYKAKFL